jgi:hypothetical protein
MLIGLGSEAHQKLHGLRMEETAPDVLGRNSHLRKRVLDGGLSSRHLETTFYGLLETASKFNELFATI